MGSQRYRYRCAARFPHPPFNPFVQFRRIRLVGAFLDMFALRPDTDDTA